MPHPRELQPGHTLQCRTMCRGAGKGVQEAETTLEDRTGEEEVQGRQDQGWWHGREVVGQNLEGSLQARYGEKTE